jgi:hypothetical protein
MAAMLSDFRSAVACLAKAAQERGSAPAEVSPEGLATLLGAIGDGLFCMPA